MKDEIFAQGLNVLGFSVVQERADPNSFGDSLVVLESPQFLVRFVSDRGQLFCNVASRHAWEDWWSLSDVLRIALGVRLASPANLSDMIAAIRKQYTGLARHLGPGYQGLSDALMAIGLSPRK
jgi:hypothetical protein